ncbi:MAG: HAMP domain-containing protein, partial [Geobacter sp.]
DDKLEAARTELTAVAGTITPDILADPVKAQKFIAGRPDTLAMFDNGVFLFSPAGKLIGGIPVEPHMVDRGYSDREYFKKTMATLKPQISEPFLSVQTHQPPVVAVTAPIFDAGGEITAILAGGIDLMKDNFLGRLASIRLGENGYLYLYNTSRLIIVHPDRERILKRDLLPGVNRLFDKAIEGFEGTGETITSKGLHSIGSFKRLKSTGWILAANFPESEAYAPVHRAKRHLLMALTVALIGSVLAVWLFMKHLTAPLLSFTSQIRELTGKKDSQARIRVETSDETGMLAEAFNAMLAELELHKKELQKQLGFSQLLIDTIPNPVYYKDAEGKYLGGNKAFKEYTGMPMDQIVGKSVL